MKYNKNILVCTSCSNAGPCREIETEHDGNKVKINICEECEKEIDDIIMWATEYSLENKKEVECPYCYSIYNIEKTGLVFECEGCESTLEVKIDKKGVPYIEEE